MHDDEGLFLFILLILRLHKNKVEQSPGWQDLIIRWCSDEAKKAGLKPQGYWGGFVIDEMKIQASNGNYNNSKHFKASNLC